MKVIIWWIILGIVLLGGLRLWVLWAQKRMSFWPDPHRQEFFGAETMGFSEVTIHTPDGLKLLAWWRRPDDGHATILFFGGNAGTIADRSMFLTALAGFGYGILGVDYRGYGGSEGSPSEKGIYLDGLAAYGFLTGEQGITPRSIIVYGQSIGGTVASTIALEREIGGMVLESSFTNATDMAKRVIPFLPLWLLMTYRFDNLGRVAKISCPKLFVHGRKDETVPFVHGERLFQNACEPKRFYPINGAMHNNILESGGADYLDFLQEFIDSATSGAFTASPEK